MAAQSPVPLSFTKHISPNRQEGDVGELAVAGIPDPSMVWQADESLGPKVFLSHRGPEAKEEIMRPTNWFLREVLQVQSFFDDVTMPPGGSKMLTLLAEAHTCTHALVLLSPLFRYSEYCVMELNTFMKRRRRGNVRLIPALWQMDTITEEGYAIELNEISWLKPETRDAPTYLINRLWPALLQTLGCSIHQPLNQILRRYVQENRGMKRDIPSSLENWVREALLNETRGASMRLAEVFIDEEQVVRATAASREGDGSVASMFSASAASVVSSLGSSQGSIEHIPVKAFGKSDDDKSFMNDYVSGSTWKYNWKRSPNGIGRDEANAFFYNPYVAYFKVQRVVVVDETSRQVMITTPMNFASYFIQKDSDLRMSLNRAYERGLNGSNGVDLDRAFMFMTQRRCQASRDIYYSNEEQSLVLRMFAGHTLEREWTLDGFPRVGGWGKFLNTILSTKIKWVAIVPGVTGVRVDDDRPGDEWTLIFRDEEAELLMGEARIFGACHGLQFRGGTFGAFMQRGQHDMLVVPKAGNILFNSERRQVGQPGDKIWKLDASRTCEDLEGLNLDYS